jgi:hypothetical protein
LYEDREEDKEGLGVTSKKEERWKGVDRRPTAGRFTVFPGP